MFHANLPGCLNFLRQKSDELMKSSYNFQSRHENGFLAEPLRLLAERLAAFG